MVQCWFIVRVKERNISVVAAIGGRQQAYAPKLTAAVRTTSEAINDPPQKC
jgi:hypothetical protein